MKWNFDKTDDHVYILHFTKTRRFTNSEINVYAAVRFFLFWRIRVVWNFLKIAKHRKNQSNLTELKANVFTDESRVRFYVARSL